MSEKFNTMLEEVKRVAPFSNVDIADISKLKPVTFTHADEHTFGIELYTLQVGAWLVAIKWHCKEHYANAKLLEV